MPTSETKQASRVDPIRVEPVRGAGDLSAALAIREIVFIEEQRVPEGLERDREDEGAFHVLAYAGKHAVGAGRLILIATPPSGEVGSWGRIGRMAVLVNSRAHGIGSMILFALEAEARRQELCGISLHAQVHARAFYEKAGYRSVGDIFEEAGIEHIEMNKRFA